MSRRWGVPTSIWMPWKARVTATLATSSPSPSEPLVMPTVVSSMTTWRSRVCTGPKNETRPYQVPIWPWPRMTIGAAAVPSAWSTP
jgi:hypothetical protein